MTKPFFAVRNPPDWLQIMARDALAAEAEECLRIRNRRSPMSPEKAGRMPVAAQSIGIEARQALLALLRDKGPLTRSQIAAELGCAVGDVDYPLTTALTGRMVAREGNGRYAATYRATGLGLDMLARAEAQKTPVDGACVAPMSAAETDSGSVSGLPVAGNGKTSATMRFADTRMQGGVREVRVSLADGV